jgi:hypothetical protein
MTRAKQGIRAGEMGSTVVLRCENFVPAMSPMGSDADIPGLLGMSALPPRTFMSKRPLGFRAIAATAMIASRRSRRLGR